MTTVSRAGMKASNSRDATPAQYLEHLRQRKGIEHARRMRDELSWRWKPSAMLWTIRHSWWAWVVCACTLIAGIVAFAADVKGLFG